MKIDKKNNWKLKVLLSILCSVILIIALFFGITYTYFVKKIEKNNETIALITFEQAEKELKQLLEKAESYLNYFYINEQTWKFVDNHFESDVEKTKTIIKIVKDFDERLDMDDEIYGFAILTGDGRTVVSTREAKSRTGKIERTDQLKLFMEESKENYPYVTWMTNYNTEITLMSSLYPIANRPMLLGIKFLGKSDVTEQDSYLLVALDEETVQNSYEMAVYNGSEALLVDRCGVILSGTRNDLLGSVYQVDETSQNLEYELSFIEWKLINKIHKKIYMREAKDIRNFGFVIVIFASFGVFVAFLVWSRKYINPIQSLMERMECVGKGQLDIEKTEKKGWSELDHLNDEFYDMVQKLKYNIQKVKIAEQEKAREELLALQYQINPHFLYNSLNSIRWMAMMTNNSIVAETITILNKIIMPILRNPGLNWKLSDELEFLKNYICL